MPWTGSTLDQVLILRCTRSKDESAEMAGNPLIPECLDFCTLGLATPRHKRKRPIKVPESHGLYTALDWIIFGTGFNQALHALPHEPPASQEPSSEPVAAPGGRRCARGGLPLGPR